MPGASEPIRRLARKSTLVVQTVADVGPSTVGVVAASSVRAAARQRRERRADREPATSRDPGRLVSVDV
ncbi:MAG TPA: hypothetical protein VHX40_05805, partial [Acidimicrobiales bacterium]|nr:hypothetical protein [Acidimicrobiales bacterium]